MGRGQMAHTNALYVEITSKGQITPTLVQYKQNLHTRLSMQNDLGFVGFPFQSKATTTKGIQY